MSVSPWVSVWCDGEDCLDWDAKGGGGHTAKEARANAKRLGWKVERPGGKDYCPRCVERAEEETDD